MKAFVLWSLVCTCAVVANAAETRSPGNVYLEGGRYKGMLVAVDQAVTFHEDILLHLKDYLEQASDVLYEATKSVSARRFDDVTIILPRSWPYLSQCQSVSTENQNAANFIVEKETYQWGSNPHTLKIDSQCGKPGKTMYLPNTFVISKAEAKKYGDNIGKTIIHEWGHLRYGLFDELEEVDDPNTCVLFDGDVKKPIKCSTEVQGDFQMSADGQKCSFQAHLQQPTDVKASLMYLPYLDTVSTFCNKTGKGITHNGAVENPQNNRCNGKSAWEVMMEHPDFKDHKVAADNSNNIQFRCVQERDVDRMVLVMDVSGSMQEEHRIQRMQQDVRLFLESLPCRDTSIGMVEFSSDMEETKITHGMAKLNIGENLPDLIKAIPSRTLEHTCIGCGIRKAIQLVEASNRTVNGTVLAVFTDGQENMAPYINEVKNEVMSRGIVVYSIMLMSQARDHPLIQLSTQTGGKACIFTDTQHTTYYDCLNGILHHRSPLTAPNQILSEVINIPHRKNHTGSVIIDQELSEHVNFVITWSTTYLAGCEDTLVSAISPDDFVINSKNNRYKYSYNLRMITIDASGYKSGKWTFKFANVDYYEKCVMRIMVEARQLLNDCSSGGVPDSIKLPVLIFPTIDSQRVELNKDNNPLDNAVKLYTEVKKGPYAVLDAVVDADIENEKGEHWTVPLYDNGTGADAVANDGVYSRYFTGFNNDGTYTATFHVVGNDKSRILLQSQQLMQSAAPILPQYRHVKNGTSYGQIDPFQRTTVAGFFEVVNYNKVANKSEVKTLFPPPKIVNLKVLSVQRLTGAITLEWTAVGDMLDAGKASFYEIRISTSADDLRNNFNKSYLVSNDEVQVGDLRKAKNVGETEHFIIVPKKINFIVNEIYYIAVKTVNLIGLKAPVSNVVVFQLKDPTYTTVSRLNPTPTSTTTQKAGEIIIKSSTKNPSSHIPNGGHGQENLLNNVTTPKQDENTEKSTFPVWVYYVMAGLGAGLLITILILCMVCCSRPSSKQRQQNSENNLPQTFIGPDGMTTANPDGVSLEVIENGGGSDQEPDLIKEINEKDLGGPKYESLKHSTWPASNKHNKSKKDKKKRANIFRSIGKSHFFSEIKKKLTHAKPADKSEREWSSRPGGSNVPLQDHPYSNPLFGNAVMVPEMEVHNSVIIDSNHNRDVKF